MYCREKFFTLWNYPGTRTFYLCRRGGYYAIFTDLMTNYESLTNLMLKMSAANEQNVSLDVNCAKGTGFVTCF